MTEGMIRRGNEAEIQVKVDRIVARFVETFAGPLSCCELEVVPSS